MIFIHDVVQGSPEWDKLHDGLWTGSVAIKLLQGKPLPKWGNFEGNIHTRRGKALEPIAIREYERQTGTKVAQHGFITNSVYKNAGYSPDGVAKAVERQIVATVNGEKIIGELLGGILLEVKCFNGERHEALVKGDIPLEVLVQIYFGMIITGLRKAKLLAFNPEYSQQLTIIDIAYDKLIGNNIRKKLRLDMKNRQLLS